MATLLIIDDDEEIRVQMKWALAGEHDVYLAEDRPSAINAFRAHSPEVCVLDLGLPPHPNDTREGIAILEELQVLNPLVKVIVVSGQGERENAIRAVGTGAHDFLSKPVDLDELNLVVRRCVYVSDLEREYRQLQNSQHAAAFEGMHGASPAMQRVFMMLKKVAGSNAPALILGESGTGKEMVARAIHNQSNRREEPFVAINCSAIPETLLESELFGYEKGAFTGADRQRKGLIEGAEGGTLFLDEIGELSASIQVKLLRFLQERRLQRVGGREELEIDTRLVAATNANLKSAIEEGRFREDLYFRLAVVVLELPPLRDRGDDAVVLAQRFLADFIRDNESTSRSFSPHAIAAIRDYDWPGNVRELQNRVQRAAIMAEGKQIAPSDLELDDEIQKGSDELSGSGLKGAKDQLEHEMLHSALQRHKGKITDVAKELGVSRPKVYDMIERFGLKKP
ncbi:MAG: PEP-CTERM-box response regulator transcription factor [Verrucomicrobiae bacterium]|nr:PEP-CTERM-box response regulator transcription factor [Verrucomicrobiae bacterium]